MQKTYLVVNQQALVVWDWLKNLIQAQRKLIEAKAKAHENY